jgi:hypothetical protein
MANDLITFGAPGPEAHKAALAYYRRAPMVVHASVLTPERCCFITGAMRACIALGQDSTGTAVILDKLGITAEEVSHECVGINDGKVH